ncbi:hypothetical protein TNCV_3564541 [Trichonephila clavipes]|nr:hypothetical protein TNCV_3564541 [Trichonephila clavipes]
MPQQSDDEQEKQGLVRKTSPPAQKSYYAGDTVSKARQGHLMSPGTPARYRKARTLSCVPVAVLFQLQESSLQNEMHDFWNCPALKERNEQWLQRKVRQEVLGPRFQSR